MHAVSQGVMHPDSRHAVRATSPLLRLPVELKLRIVKCLTARAVAVTACVSVELNMLTSNESIWQEKIKAEFGDRLIDPTANHGWRNAFVQLWSERKRERARPSEDENRFYFRRSESTADLIFRSRPMLGGDPHVGKTCKLKPPLASSSARTTPGIRSCSNGFLVGRKTRRQPTDSLHAIILGTTCPPSFQPAICRFMDSGSHFEDAHRFPKWCSSPLMRRPPYHYYFDHDTTPPTRFKPC